MPTDEPTTDDGSVDDGRADGGWADGGAPAALPVVPPLPACYTPQQVRFTDARGTLWTVRCAHTLTAADAPARVPGSLPILIDDEGLRIAACRAGRCWLEFGAAGERRRLRLVPPRWYTLSHAALALLCEEAEVVAGEE